MAVYQYIARSQTGQQVNGTIQADSETAAVRSLDEQSLYPIRVVEQPTGAVRQARGNKASLGQLSVFYGQLADLLNAGVPILRALKTILKATKPGVLHTVLAQVAEDVAEGQTLADAMDEHPGVFPPLQVAMVRAGETAGFLEDVCTNLSDFLERQEELRSKIRGAMIYPVMLVVLGAGILAFILIGLVPQFRGPFKGMPLPAPTRILFALSGFLINYQWLALLLLIGSIGGLVAFIRSHRGRTVWDQIKVRMPILGSTIRAICISRFCRIFGTMLVNGVPILKALKISQAAAGNVLLERAVARAAEAVEAGEDLADPLGASGIFPTEVVEMIAVGEESNQLEKVLLQVAETTERRTNRKVDQAVRLIEPLILVVIAALVGFVALGLLYPIFTMSRTIR
ncbi:MAG: type II secretion system F family protein [Phycisphaerae bacterium]